MLNFKKITLLSFQNGGKHMKLSARNQLKGTITAIEEGAVNGIVTLNANGITLKGTISLNSIKSLELAVGKEAYAIFKATEVMIATGQLNISARNQIKGTITSIEEGSVNGIVTLNTDSFTISSTISMSAIKELQLSIGLKATAIIKATSVMFGVED